MNMINPYVNRNLIAILALLVVPLTGLSIDIYVPSLPAVTSYFNTNKALVQLSITTYMIGLGIMQLFGGSISDSFGRKYPFTFAMIIYIVATILVTFSANIYHLLVLRFIQGISIAVAIVPMRSVISDLYEGRDFLKMATYMTMSWSIGPIIAPAIGGFLQHYYNWQASFYFLAIYSFVIFLLTIKYLPETSKHRHNFHLKEILTRYLNILSKVDFSIGLLINGMLYAFIVLFGVVTPFIIQTVLGYSALEFGNIALLMGLAWFLGTLCNRFLINIDLYPKVKIALLSMWLITFVMMLFSILLPLNIYNIVIPLSILFWLGGIVFPNYFARCVSLFPRTTGSANALFGGFVFFIAGLFSALGSLLRSTSELPLALTYFSLITLCLVLFTIDLKRNRQ